MEKFVLIDGNAILHRAFHALPPLTSKNGEVANAVYGFFSMFIKILSDLKPDFLAVCFDKAAPTFRQQLFVGYQAHRPKMADDLRPQIVIVHEVLQKMGVAIFEVDGYEADDLIGTLAFQAVFHAELRGSKTQKNAENVEVIIVSGDRDMLQLVNSHVKVLAPVVGLTKMILFDEKTVEEKYGLNPSKIIDYKALVGDASDNYPGVSGIGPKTAAELLKKYGTFENLYKSLNELPEKISQKLATDVEQAALAKKLATIVTDAPIRLDLDQCSCAKLNRKNLQEEFEKLGFKSLVKRLEGKRVEETKEPKGTEVKKQSQQMELI